MGFSWSPDGKCWHSLSDFSLTKPDSSPEHFGIHLVNVEPPKSGFCLILP